MLDRCEGRCDYMVVLCLVVSVETFCVGNVMRL